MRRAPLETVLWIGARIILTVLIVLIILFLVNYASTKNIDIKGLKVDLIAKRLYYSDDCFALKDEKVKVGEIDLKKFNEKTLKKCVNKVPVRVELVNKKIIISNDNSFDDKAELCFNNEKECMTSYGLTQMLGDFNKKMEDCYFSSRCLHEVEQYVLVDDERDIMKVSIILE